MPLLGEKIARHTKPNAMLKKADRPADRAIHTRPSNAQDAVRNPAANRNRDPRSAKLGGTLRVGRRQPGEPRAARRHTGKTPPQEAELMRHYIGEASE